MSCPSFTELCTSNAVTTLQVHLADCPRCRAIVARVEASEAPREFVDVLAPQVAGPLPQPGGVWTFWAPGSDEYLVGAVIEAAPTELLIVPLLAETAWATNDDLVLSWDVLGYPALAPIWGADHVLLEQAVEPVDVLSEENLATLNAAYDAFFAGEGLPVPGGPPAGSTSART